MGVWRYMVRRVSGNGGQGTWLDLDIPIQGVQLTDTLSGPSALNGTISPKLGRLLAPDGSLLLEEWGSEVWAEHNGQIAGGGIVTHSALDGPNWALECHGYAGYPSGMPYTGNGWYGVEIDVFDIVRHIWAHLQAQAGGNLGLEVSNAMSGVKIGTELEQDQFDPQGGGQLVFESGPYKLAWYMTPDLGQNIEDLASSTPFDYHERHWWDGDNLRHALDLFHPKMGRRRTDLRFVIGENVTVIPSVDRSGDDFANEILGQGAGDGVTMIRGYAGVRDNRLRRVKVIEDKTAKTVARIDGVCKTSLAWRNTLGDVTNVVVADHPHAPSGSISVGDEICLQGDADWVDLDIWCRVLSISIAPEAGDDMTLELIRADRLVT